MIGKSLITTDLFSNPFEEINANVIDSKRIVEYWCNPFELGLLTNFDEHKFRTSKIPIILQGSRGSGKTTILKYYSFPAQLERSELHQEKSVLKRIKAEGEIGFYYRCEESFVSTFTAIFKKLKPEQWTSYFECYIELIFAEKILEMLLLLKERGEIEALPSIAITRILSKVGTDVISGGISVELLHDLIHKNVVYFEQYKNRIAFMEEKFDPQLFVDIFSLSSAIVKEIKALIPEFKNVLFVLMVDEYENLNNEIQKRFNTIIKFVKPEISIRIGRRSEGVFTTETVNDVEYLRENHDYFLASLGNEQNINIIKKYFSDVANRRFQKTDFLFSKDGSFDIVQMLGDKEDLLEECLEICGGRKLHLDMILKQSSELNRDPQKRKEIIDIIKNDENPIAETINALWVIRNNQNKKDRALYAAAAMESYFKGMEGEGVSKFRSDYSNKYRYAITVYICSVYKREKMYYGFNALSHLSNGNVRTFINFCQSIINEALFYEKSKFLKTGRISKETQSSAIKKFARSEFESICSVVYAGDKIKTLISNLGNSFSIYHKDRRIRYPETTQFAFDKSRLYREDVEVIKTAESWAIIVRREKEQRTSAGVEERTELCHMNKMFSPLFNISYRTRGGINLRLSSEEMHSLLVSASFYPESVRKLMAGQDIDQQITINESNIQLSLFDMGLNNG